MRGHPGPCSLIMLMDAQCGMHVKRQGVQVSECPRDQIALLLLCFCYPGWCEESQSSPDIRPIF